MKNRILILGGGTGGTHLAYWFLGERGLRARSEVVLSRARSSTPTSAASSAQPPRQADVPAVLLARPAARARPFGLTLADFVPQVDGIITVGEFYEHAAGGQIIFT